MASIYFTAFESFSLWSCALCFCRHSLAYYVLGQYTYLFKKWFHPMDLIEHVARSKIAIV